MEKLNVGDRVTVVNQAWSRVFGSPDDRVCRYNSNGNVRIFKVVAKDCQIRVKDGYPATADTLLASCSLPREQYVAINCCNCEPTLDVRNVDIRFVTAGGDVTSKLS